ncbi:MAG: hypothetical protein JO354_09085 [Verrucomicrobia bacterium]|nr:hypothetical protein [Verrucomicrobiota bacterium]
MLRLNLLHEEIAEQRQRQRDPLKLTIYVGIGIAALFALNYLWTGYRVLNIKSQLASVERDWSKIEPKVTAAQKRAGELNAIIGTTKTLDGIMESRFYWAPLLAKVADCVTPNVQLTSIDGSAEDESRGISLVIDGLAAGSEPRAVAEDFRQMLLEQIGKDHPGMKAEFKTLEDLDTVLRVSGNNAGTAHFVVAIEFNPSPIPAPTPQTRRSRSKKDE